MNLTDFAPVECPSNSSINYLFDEFFGRTEILRFNEPDLFKCRQIPYFCDNRDYPKLNWKMKDEFDFKSLEELQEHLESIEDNGWLTDRVWKNEMESIPNNPYPYYQFTKGCCQCERHSLPYFFKNKEIVDSGFTDNKHGLIQLSLLAVEDTDLTVVVELLNAQYIKSFDDYMPDRAEIYVHRPGRAKYTPTSPSRAAFVAVITDDQFKTMSMPLNLPVETYRLPNSPIGGARGTTSTRFENKVLIGRISDVAFGDENYQRRIEDQQAYEYLTLKLANNGAPPDNKTLIEWWYVPDVETESSSLYSVPDDWGDVQKQYLWWSVGDSEENEFLGKHFIFYILYFNFNFIFNC